MLVLFRRFFLSGERGLSARGGSHRTALCFIIPLGADRSFIVFAPSVGCALLFLDFFALFFYVSFLFLVCVCLMFANVCDGGHCYQLSCFA